MAVDHMLEHMKAFPKHIVSLETVKISDIPGRFLSFVVISSLLIVLDGL